MRGKPPHSTLGTLPPELVEDIVEHLHQNDLAQCVRVCRSWRDALTPYLWELLVFFSQAQLARFLSHEAQQALHRNALFVRELHLAHDEMYDRLLSPAITRSWRSIFRQNRSEDSGSRRPLFTNLDVLELHPPVHPKRVSSKDIMTLVQQNPRMRGLRINVDLDPRVLLTMITSHMPHLQDLHLASTWRGDVKVLLEELPECIRTIWLRNVHYTGSCFNSTNGSSNVTSDSADAMAVRRHPALESFVIEGDLSGQDALVLAPFLKSCSQKLKHVEGLESTFYQTPMVVEALLEIGYRWKVLVRQPWQHYLSDAQLADIIRRSAHWTHIDLHTCVVGPLTADAIVENGAHLETLEVFDSGAKGLMGSHLQTVLCRAPHLLSLQAHWLVEQDVIHAADILSSDWVTTSLVRIDFKIDVPRATREDAPDSAAVQSSRDVQRQILRRLGQQKNLQWLAIGGMVIIPQLGGFRHQRNCLEMTLESGLDELAGLKSLEFLDVHHMDHRIGLPELEWMQEHLPNLQHVRGMYNSLIPPTLEVRQWIRINQPGWWR